MNMITKIAIVLAAAFSAGCSSISINHDWDKDAPFPDYKTYQWLEVENNTVPGNARTAQRSNDLYIQRVRRAVNAELDKKGLKLVDTEPDLLVVFHTGVEQKINVTDWGYRYSYDYWGWGGRQIDVYQYDEGTLIVDLIDARAKELVWRGSGTRTVDPNWSPEKIDNVVQDAIKKIFTKYPPPR
jgi:hypothetical protein